MMPPHAKPATTRKQAPSVRRPAGMQSIRPALYQQIRQAVQELSQPKPSARVA